MQTKTKTKLLAILLFGMASVPVLFVRISEAATSNGDLSVFTLSENPLASNHETQFVVTLDPEPTDQVTTTFTTNGECTVGFNMTDFTTGGSVVTQNGSLPFGLRALNDSDGEGEHVCDIEFRSQSTVDPEYLSPVTLNYSVQIIDDDIVLSYDYSLSTLTNSRLREGDSFVEQYRVSISEPPVYDITISALADDQCDLLSGIPEQRSKTVTTVIPAGTTDSAIFTILPVQDSDFEGIHRCSISHTASTTDVNYQTITIPPYSATVLDDDENPNIPDEREYEGGLIYFADANFDGIDDEDQPNVTSFINPNREARQAVMIVDENGVLRDDCRFEGPVTSSVYDDSSTSIESGHGQLQFEVACALDENYQVIWLLDQYIQSADSWTIYNSNEAGTLRVQDFDAIIFNLGNDFTTGIEMLFDNDGPVSVLQSAPEFLPEPTAFDESLTANVNNTKLNPLALFSAISASLTVLWLVYRRFFSNVDTTKSRYPRVDRF